MSEMQTAEIVDYPPAAQPSEAVASTSTSIMAVIAKAASDPRCDIEKMDRLLQMQQKIMDREAEREYTCAFVRVQASLPHIYKNVENRQTKSRYANLEAINAAVIPVYTKEGFSLSFGTEDSPMKDHVRIVCDVLHASGASRRYHYDAPMDSAGINGTVNKTPTHARGSAISYGQRYLTKMIFNLTLSDEDDDGNEAGARRGQAPSESDKRVLELVDQIAAMADESGLAEINAVIKAEFNPVPKVLISAWRARMKELKQAV